jgi:ATP-dependent Lon protease, bacterial type
MTGNLGDVMKESAQIAWQYIKAHPELAQMTTDQFMEKDIHVHVPEGAVPKDGPSAGITMVSSMVSALRGQALKSGIAMTGEMTLRGRVLRWAASRRRSSRPSAPASRRSSFPKKTVKISKTSRKFT